MSGLVLTYSGRLHCPRAHANNNKHKKLSSRNISYLVIIMKRGQRFRTLDIATLNPKSGGLTTTC